MSIWWRIWTLALGLKLILAGWLPLSPDESYYWVWGQHLQLSYYDHPPMVALLMALGDSLAWLGQMVRWPAVLLAHLGLWFWKDLFKDWLTERQQILWLVLVCLMPLTGPGSLIVTPDLPLMFSWSLSLWTFQRLLNSNGHWRWGLAFGAAFGFGVLSKYLSVLVIPIVFIWWWARRRDAPLTRWLTPTIVAAVAISAPVWIWNLQNDWASFRFQLHHGLGRKSWKPSWTYEYVLAQMALLFPTILWLGMRSRASLRWKAAAWFPLGFFFFTSFRGYVEANWPVMAHPMVLALSIERAGDILSRGHKLAAGAWIAGLVAVLAFMAAPRWPDSLWLTKLRDLRQTDALVKAVGDLSPVYARSYQVAAKLSYELRRPIVKLRGMNRRDFFDTLPESIPGGDHFFLVVEPGDRRPPPWDTWTEVRTISVDSRYLILELVKP